MGLFGKKAKETEQLSAATAKIDGPSAEVQATPPQPAPNPGMMQQPMGGAMTPQQMAMMDPNIMQQPTAREQLIAQGTNMMQPPMGGAMQQPMAGMQQPMTASGANVNQPQDQDNGPSTSDAPDDGVEANGKKRERPKKPFRYTIINTMGKKESGTFDAESEEDVRNFLISQDFQILKLGPKASYDIVLGENAKIKAADLSFSLTQLSTYIKSGIPLADSVKILAKQARNAQLKKTFNQLVYELLRGESFSDAMTSQGQIYPPLLINMVRTAEMTGDLPSILDDMAEYYTSMEQTRKQMKSAMTYPAVVLTLAFGVLIFMLTYLVPQFASMFAENDATLPAITLMVLGASEFIKKNWLLMIVSVLVFAIAFIYAYKKVKSFRVAVQFTLMHLPVVNNIIIYNEIANFTKTFASLLNHGVFITDSMEILSKITNNEIYKSIINKCLVNLGKGDSVSSAFKGEWAIPVVAYEMIVTGESTGQLGTMMEKVANHFQSLHKNVIDQMKSLIEPIMIVVLAIIVGIILISIIQPMFSIYSQVQ